MITTTTVAVSFNLPAEHEAEQKFRISHDMKEWVCLEYAGVRTYEKVERITVDTNVGDKEGMDELISRQDAIDAINALHDKPNAWLDCAVDAVMALPTEQPEEVIPHRNYKFLSDYWCECGWHLGKKGDVKYCADCGRKVNWDG